MIVGLMRVEGHFEQFLIGPNGRAWRSWTTRRRRTGIGARQTPAMGRGLHPSVHC